MKKTSQSPLNNSFKILKPQKLSDFLGQEHIIGPNKILSLLVEKQKLFSIIFYGPPGSGKSSLAQVLAKSFQIEPVIFNSTLDNQKDFFEKIQLLEFQFAGPKILIVEEIHRMNISKQDLFLDLIENQKLIIFATTTENPYFVINPAVRSRSQLIEVKSIPDALFVEYIQKLMEQKVLSTQLTEVQVHILAQHVNGDMRVLLATLEKCSLLYPQFISDADLQILLNLSYFGVGSDNDQYHNLKSALQKSIRGSDPDASLYYLAHLLHGGDLKTITRRLTICAYEDIGLANLTLCHQVAYANQLVNQVGMPEAQNILGPLVVAMALSPKSNSGSQALAKALQAVIDQPNVNIPKHLWDNHYASAVKLGVKGYVYPHDYPFSYYKQQYLPNELITAKFYEPKPFCQTEEKWQQYWKIIRKQAENDS